MLNIVHKSTHFKWRSLESVFITQLLAFEDVKFDRQNEGILTLNDLDKEEAPAVIQAIE
jgi:hypothetical protein